MQRKNLKEKVTAFFPVLDRLGPVKIKDEK